MSKLFRRFLAAGAAAIVLSSIPFPTNAAAEKFQDVQPGKWYYTAVEPNFSFKKWGGGGGTARNSAQFYFTTLNRLFFPL